MSEKKRQEFLSKVKAAHDAVNDYAKGFADGNWFQRDLDNRVRNAVDDLLAWGVVRRPTTDKERRRLAGAIAPTVKEEDALDAEFIDG